jgi:hypothetical protein
MKRNIIAVVLTCAAIGAVIAAAGFGRPVAEIVGAGFSRPVAAQAAPCAPSGGLTFICGVQNAEDLVLVPNSRWLIASGMAPGSGLHAVDTRAKTIRNMFANASTARLDKAKYANCPGTLDPKQAVLHGLSLRPAQNGRYTVYATNHGGRESVEVFELDTSGAAPSATWVGCVVTPNGMALNSVAAFSDGSLVATVLILPGKTFADAFAQRNTGVVLAWMPGEPTFRVLPGTELSANNGIETSPDDREFFVVSTTTKRVIAYARNNPGKPLRTAQLKEFAPDNVRWTADNRLITAGMLDDSPGCGGAPKTEEGIRCPRGYVVAAIDPKTMAITEIARGPATPSFTGTAIAMRVGDELWLGSFNADRLAYRSLK